MTAIVPSAVGIGYGIAYRLAEAGANVAIASLHKAEADNSAADLTKAEWKAMGIEADELINSAKDIKDQLEC